MSEGTVQKRDYLDVNTAPPELEGLDRLIWMKTFRHIYQLHANHTQRFQFTSVQTRIVFELYKRWLNIGHLKGCASSMNLKCAKGKIRHVFEFLFPEVEIPEYSTAKRGTPKP
jgi:hypothetical protein